MSQRSAGKSGAHWDGEGVHFALQSFAAEQVELCLFEPDGRQASRQALTPSGDDHWSTFVPGTRPGQHYGYRVHGQYDPDKGLRCNPAKLLIDPYTRRLAGSFHWNPAVHDYLPGSGPGHWQINTQDSAPFVPRSVVTAPAAPPLNDRPRINWRDAIVYEANVRGFTMRFPGLDETERGSFRGLTNGQVLDYLKALGITSLELQPVQAWIDESFLAEHGRRNFWGYNTVAFFSPEMRYAGENPVAEFIEMANAIHDAGIEIILDVAYNHTGEGDSFGPTLSFRGIDNLAWYRTEPEDPGVYVNDTGTGNTINADHPRVQELVIESLSYWHREMGVDGFRFDLATVLGRNADGFDPGHPLLRAIEKEPRLTNARLIAEPWDPGAGGYQLGRFQGRWSEWNDRYRDALRQFWRGDHGHLPELASRMQGSVDLFAESINRLPASVNFIASHDGFTLMDVVSYSHRHNEANGQGNQDGHAHNLSCNHGVEGQSDRPVVAAMRRRHRINLLASLLLSGGVPMLLAGDEFGNSQGGNNNAYAQDNETGWLDWDARDQDPEFPDIVRELIALRQGLIALLEPESSPESEQPGFLSSSHWLDPVGRTFSEEDWSRSRAAMLISPHPEHDQPTKTAIIINGRDREVTFHLPPAETGQPWTLAFSSDLTHPSQCSSEYAAAAWSIACLVRTERT